MLAFGIKEEDFLASAAECSKISWELRVMDEVNGCSILVDRREKSDYFRDDLRTKERPNDRRSIATTLRAQELWRVAKPD
jgi:hypothetical protein